MRGVPKRAHSSHHINAARGFSRRPSAAQTDSAKEAWAAAAAAAQSSAAGAAAPDSLLAGLLSQKQPAAPSSKAAESEDYFAPKMFRF